MPALYEIRVQEQIGDGWLGWFEGFSITRFPSGGPLLAGPIVDQPALHGLLAKIRDLNLTLISVNRMEMIDKQA